MKLHPTSFRFAWIAVAAFALSLLTGNTVSAASVPARKACCVKKTCGMSCCKPQTGETLRVDRSRAQEAVAGRLAPLDPCECDISAPRTPADRASSSSPVSCSSSVRSCGDGLAPIPAPTPATARLLSFDHPPAQPSRELRATHLRF